MHVEQQEAHLSDHQPFRSLRRVRSSIITKIDKRASSLLSENYLALHYATDVLHARFVLNI